jgi:protein TonB
MFAESMLETSWGQWTRRSWTTLTSFGLQVVLIGVLLTIPLLRTAGIPRARTVSTPITVGRRDPISGTPVRARTASAVSVIPYDGRLMMPTRIPTTISHGDGSAGKSESGGSDRLGDVGLQTGPSIGFPLTMSGTRPLMPLPAAPKLRPFRTSSMLQGSLIRQVEPVYPPLARSALIQGPVILEAAISKEGVVEHPRLISGHPLLVPAAVAAVSQWRYRPYILNGEAIEVETQITVNFVLSGK